MLHLALLASLVTGGQVASVRPDPFPYSMDKTPEEGPVDPAVSRRYSTRWQACTKSTAATPNLVPCYEREYAFQDAILNRRWRAALQRLPARRRPALVDAERRWAAARDPFCERFVGGLRGSLVSVASLDCRIELTIRRTMWLETL